VSRFQSVLHIVRQEDGMKRLSTLFSLSALLALAPDASAQQPVPVAAIGRWDVAGQLALLNRNKTELGSRWDHWYEAPLIQASAGHYWTPHVKTELEIATSGQGTIGIEEDLRYREHMLRESTLGATAVYQFLDNQWVHPFVGAGLEVARERHVAESLP
jgi:opacity protein-like surface antigen